MSKTYSIIFESSLSDFSKVNSSFDSAVLRVAYPGFNRNGSFISKESFKRNIKTMFNCPIVCHYIKSDDKLGGHDIEIEENSEGDLNLVNLTQPIGVIPESARYWWDKVTEDDGTEHEYLFAEVLLWKRQEAYRKIKKDGIVRHSMEVTVKSGEVIDGVYYIYDFEFTAFALIGVEPCFESSALITAFSADKFKKDFSAMMREIKESFGSVNTLKKTEDIRIQDKLTEGGKDQLDEKIKLAEKFGFKIDELDFSVENMSVKELTEMFKAMVKRTEGSNDAFNTDTDNHSEFTLTGTMIEEISRTVSKETTTTDWGGEFSRYIYADCDFDAQEVYCWDTNDWLLYGFKYALDGDAVSVDFESKSRKKYAIVAFSGGEQNSPFADKFNALTSALTESMQWKSKFEEINGRMVAYEAELNDLRKYKDDVQAKEVEAKYDAIKDRFSDLTCDENFAILCGEKEKYTPEEFEEKCYALRGRNAERLQFSCGSASQKVIVSKNTRDKPDPDDPYHGVVEELLGKIN